MLQHLGYVDWYRGNVYARSGWDGVSFLRVNLYDAVFLICDQNSVDTTAAFYLWLKSAYAVPRPALFLPLPPASRWDRCGQEVGRGHN